MTEATYKFEYAIQRLREAINYSEQVRDYTQIRIWVNHVEAAYKADIEAEQELTKAANAGAKLMHSLATGGESRLDADLAAMLQWEDEKPVAGINWQNYPDFEDEPKEAQPKIDFNSIPEIKF